MSSITRTVILGAVYQFQPVHGYFLRRELATWHVDSWANIQPGTIYNGLRSLEKDGYIVIDSQESEGNRPARTTYRISEEGEVELLRMIRDALWNVEAFDTKTAMLITSFNFVLRRQEMIAGLEHRISKIDALILENNFHIEDTENSPTTPKYVREIFELSSARLRAEQEWARNLVDRVRGGAYYFRGEEGANYDRSPANE